MDNPATTDNEVQPRGFLSSDGVERSVPLILCGVAVTAFLVLSVIGRDAPAPEPEADRAPLLFLARRPVTAQPVGDIAGNASARANVESTPETDSAAPE